MKSIYLRSSLVFLLIALVPLLTYARMECTGSCPSGCISWYISYETDCDCAITDYESIHFVGYAGGFPIMEFMNSQTNPEFLGMNASGLGCDCQRCS